MTGETLRRSNWTANELPARRSQFENRPASQEDPLAELERIVMRGDPFADRVRPAPSPAPSNVEQFPMRREERPPVRRLEEPRPRAPIAEQRAEDIFGVDEAAFEAALRGATAPASAPAPMPAEPRFTEIDVARFDAEFAPRPEQVTVPRAHATVRRDQQAPVAAPQPHAEPRDSEFMRGLDRELAPSEPPVFVESAEPAFEHETSPEPQPRPRRAAGLMTVAAVMGLVALGLGGAVGFTMVTGGARNPGGEPVVVRADERPTRIVPQQTADDPNKPVQDRLEAQVSPANERVVRREEEPVQALTQQQPTRTDVRTGMPQGAEPRRVTTTTIRVRPDGTMESEPTRPQMAMAAAQAPRTTSSVPASPTRPAQEQAAAPTPSAVPAPVPPARAERPAPTQAEGPSLASAPQPAANGQANRPVSGPLVQISSQPSEEAARTTLADLQRRFPQLQGRQSNIRSATAGERTVYRVRVGGFGSQGEATQFCQRLRSAGGDCFVVPN